LALSVGDKLPGKCEGDLRALRNEFQKRVPEIVRPIRSHAKFPANPSKKKSLFAQTKFLHNGLVAFGIVFLQVVKQAATLADQHEKPAARAVVFLVRFEVLRQLANTFTQQCNLDFRTSGIGWVNAMLVNEGLFLLSG
jgi:hypothetical protein